MQTHNLTEYPKELSKKVTLLQHFRSYLENNKDAQPGDDNTSPKASAMGSSVGGDTKGVYVKKWMRTKHAIMFRLSNKIVQVNF